MNQCSSAHTRIASPHMPSYPRCHVSPLIHAVIAVISLSSDGLRQHHRSAVPGGWQDFHKEVHHRQQHNREREGQGHQLHHHAWGYHRGRVRGRTRAHTEPIISVQNVSKHRLLEFCSEPALIFFVWGERKISLKELFTLQLTSN